MQNVQDSMSQMPQWVNFVVLLMILAGAALATKKRLEKKKKEEIQLPDQEK